MQIFCLGSLLDVYDRTESYLEILISNSKSRGRMSMVAAMSKVALEPSGDSSVLLEPLTPLQVKLLKSVHGPNIISYGHTIKWYKVFAVSFTHPFNLLLIVLAIASAITKEYGSMAVMLVMVSLASVISFTQQWNAKKAAQRLQEMITNKIWSIRRPVAERTGELPVEELVPGDWVKVCSGDLIPADIQLIDSKDLFVSESSLTGEALPVAKNTTAEVLEYSGDKYYVLMKTMGRRSSMDLHIFRKKKLPLIVQFVRFLRRISGLGLKPDESSTRVQISLENPGLCYKGTSVLSGVGIGIVKSIGNETYYGVMAKYLAKPRPENAFQIGVRHISWLFFLIMAILIPPIFIIQAFSSRSWLEAALFSFSITVGLTPEMLPTVLSATLARGAHLMSKRKCIVKNMESIINMGGMNILCADKTGTLTEDQVTLLHHLDQSGEQCIFTLQLAMLNSYFQTGLKNLLDTSIVQYYKDQVGDSSSMVGGESEAMIVNSYTKLDELPFDFVRRRMSVLIESKASNNSPGHIILVTKGAVEEIFAVCSHVYMAESDEHDDMNQFQSPKINRIASLSPEMLDKLQNLNNSYNENGIRVVAVAFKQFTARPASLDQTAESDMVFVGFIAFQDPPKESARPAIKYLLEHNVAIKILTGDSASVCRRVCEVIKLPVTSIVTAKEVEAAAGNEAELKKLVSSATIFAKLTPLQKALVVRTLKASKNIVGFLGDGINDAPAIKEADVGISVDTGADIAKEASDIILLGKDLRVISDGVIYGRCTFGNTMKYLVMVLSSNFGNVLSILIASNWLPFLPMSPIHLLTQNLLYDVSQIAIPWDRMDPAFLLVPHPWSTKNVVWFMVCIGPWSSLFDVMTFAYLYFYYGIQTEADDVVLFQTTWFTVGLLTQTFIVHMIRTPRIPFVQSMAALPVIGTTFVISGIALALPYIPYVSTWLNLKAIPALLYAFIFGIVVSYCIVIQVVKTVYIKVLKRWY